MGVQRKACLLLAIFVASATPAHAHLMNTGFGPFYDGLAHPLMSPEDLLPVAAMTLLAGLGGAR
jgi:urease accessory protein